MVERTAIAILRGPGSQFLILCCLFFTSGIGPSGFAAELWVGSHCQVWDDEQGVPHLRADTELAGLSCLGYVHARDRIWQMDYFKKVADGRKAEFFGKDGIRSDFFLRLMGLREKAESLYSQLSEEQRSLLKAYAWGVNHGIQEIQKNKKQGRDGTYVFQDLEYWPDEWKPEDSLKVLLLQSFDQTRRSFENQLREEEWLEKYPGEAQKLFSSEGLPWDVPIVKPGEISQSTPQPVSLPVPLQSPRQSGASARALQTLLEIPGIWNGPGVGSNNWVIAADHSKTGHALLANDPHLSLTHPPIWYWAHLTAGGSDAIGATVPGLPVVTMGASQNLSWGITNAYLPVARLSHVSELELKGATQFRPWIWVKFWKFKLPFFFKTFRKTPGGLPILPLPAPEGQALVLNWTTFDLKPSDIFGLFELQKAKSVEEADRILATVRVPAWNLVFADGQGGIGYRAIGRTPRFKQSPPFGVPLEKLADVEHSDAFLNLLTPDEMPHLIRPVRGWITTANNRQWPHHSAWSLGDAQLPGLRAARIEELLSQKPKHDLESMGAIQCDLQAMDARYLLPRLLIVLGETLRTEHPEPQNSPVLKAYELLKTWDYQTGLQCQACGIYRRWLDRVFTETSLNVTSLSRELQKPQLEAALKDVVIHQFHQALSDLKLDSGGALIYPWGHYHRNSFFHLIGKSWYPTTPIPTPGDEFTVNPGVAEWNQGFYDQTAGASQRILIEMSNPPKVYSVVAGPQKNVDQRNLEQPQSEWQKWVRCEQSRRLFPLDWQAVESKAVRVQF